MSGRPANVAEFLTRLTAPVRVSENGAGNTSVSDSPLEEPVRYALPVSAVGYSGEMAVADPTAEQPALRFRHSALIDARLGASVAGGKASATDRLVSWLPVWVIAVERVTCLSALSRAAVTLNAGA